MVAISQFVVNWLLISALYALVAIGFTMIFGVGNVINLAHAVSIILGGFMGVFITQAGYPALVGIGFALLVPALFNLALYLGLIRYLEDRPITVLLVTFLWVLIVEEFFLQTMGNESYAVEPLFAGSIRVLGASLTLNRLFLFVISWVIIGVLFLFVNRTQTGRAMLATSMSEKGASMVGIDNMRINLYTWIIAGALAGLAGLFLATFQTAEYDMGIDPLLLSFSIVVIGGLGSIRGSVIAAYLIGLFEVATVTFISPNLTGITPLLMLVGVLIVKPEGMYGRGFTGDI
jgi:branched-chain amino acid transport system permease protein